MKKVLVTGASGFVGRHVVTALLDKGFRVIATSTNPQKAVSFAWFHRVEYIPFDLKNIDPGQDYFDFFKRPDLVIHLAWEGLPNYKSAFHVEENLPRHYQFLQNLVQNGLKDLTVIGTCFEYGRQEGCLSEDLPSLPENPYAIAKNSLRLQLEALRSAHSFTLKWVRLFYMYGEGQNPNSLLSQLQSAIDKGETQFNMSPGDQLRDYLEVTKVAEYVVAVASQQQVSGIINCCSGVPIPVKQLVEDYLRRTGQTIKLNLGHYAYSDLEPKNFWGDTKKLKTILTDEQ